tara:strand:- start:7923 stop:8219 length:297 start_codon:yes stop_codon:yes gene_type:complete
LPKKKILLKILFINYINTRIFLGSILLIIKKIFFPITLNVFLFLFLIIGIQNSSKRIKVNLLINETIYLPVSFIIGTSFISGSMVGSIINFNQFFNKK